jgi:hypothetical protein
MASADTSITSDPAAVKEPVKVKKNAANRERAARFYQALESLMDAYGEDQALWPDNKERQFVEAFLRDKDALTLRNCIFGRNLLGLGIGETAKDAEESLKQGAVDAWGLPYSMILAGSKDVPKLIEILYAIGVNRGVSLFNRDITAKVFVFLKADFHSLFADIFKNFNGESVLIMAREIHMIGAPGSTEQNYGERLRPALCVAESLEATVYIGENDPVTDIVPRGLRDKFLSLLGYVIPKYRGRERDSDECANKKPPIVNMIRLKDCSHDIPQYHPGMRAYGRTMLKK